MTFLAPPAPGPLVVARSPSFSVVVPAFEAADTVAAAVGSALGQSPPPHEVVVVDDGSTDGTAAALGPVLGRIRLIRQDNRGEAAARNRGVAAATGEYVVMLDADDVFLPGRLAALGNLAAARPDLDLLTTDGYVTVDGARARRFYDGPSGPFPVDDQRLAILRWNFLFPQVAVRREAYLAAGGYTPGLEPAADWALWGRMILSGARAGAVDAPLGEYRLHDANMTNDRPATWRARSAAFARLRDEHRLSPRELELVDAQLTRWRSESLITALDLGLASGAARRPGLALARARGLGRRARIAGLLAVAAPSLARRALRSRDSRAPRPRLPGEQAPR